MGLGVTIFTIPHPFKADVGTRQTNAINSWRAADYNIILCGDDKSVIDFAYGWNCWSLPSITRNSHGTPLIDYVFSEVQDLLKDRFALYVDADVMLTESLANAIHLVSSELDKFLVIGRRYDADVSDTFDFTGDWRDRLYSLADGVNLHSPFGLSYFGFRAPLWPTIPPFAIGRQRWNNWLAAEAESLGAHLVDVTGDVIVIHQNHGYAHMGIKHDNEWEIHPEVLRNRELSEGRMGSAAYVHWRLIDGELVKA